MFNINREAMEAAYQTLHAHRDTEPAFGGLVRNGLRHLLDHSHDFDACLDCDSAQTKHFFHELATLKTGEASFSDVADCWLCLFEDLALFFRERFLRHPEKDVPEVERTVMNYFESSGEWHPEDSGFVSYQYWTGLPERWREEYRRRGSRSLHV